MDISKYADYFHDGSVFDIQDTGEAIVFSMLSAEMDKDDVEKDVILSKDSSIQDKLHIEKIRNIKINQKQIKGNLKQVYDDGGILSFEISKNFIKLVINWVNFPPKPEVNEFDIIEIEADKIWWENIPNLLGNS